MPPWRGSTGTDGGVGAHVLAVEPVLKIHPTKLVVREVQLPCKWCRTIVNRFRGRMKKKASTCVIEALTLNISAR